MRNSQRRTSLATGSLIIFVALLSGLIPAGAKTATPDAITVTSTQGVTLCRPKGTRCFVPEVDDPIFIGDVITTTSSGRLEFKVPGSDRSAATHIFVLTRSKIRIDRDTEQDFVKVEILSGTIGVEPSKGQSFAVSFDSMVCIVGSGRVAIGYNMPKKRTGSASVSNVSATCRCLSTPGGDYDIPVNTVVSFKSGRRINQGTVAEGFWSKLTQIK